MLNLLYTTKLMINISQFFNLLKYKFIISVCNYYEFIPLNFDNLLFFQHYNPQDFNPQNFEESSDSQSDQPLELSEVEWPYYSDSENSNDNLQNENLQGSSESSNSEAELGYLADDEWEDSPSDFWDSLL